MSNDASDDKATPQAPQNTQQPQPPAEGPPQDPQPPADASSDDAYKEYRDTDAPRSEVILYAAGNIENAVANQFFNVINLIMVVAMGISPLLIGLIMGIKTIWDGVTDPVMAYITDNTRSRWGRRRPYILVGGVGRIMFLLLVMAFFPHTSNLKTNKELEAEKHAEAAAETNTVMVAEATNAVADMAAVTNVPADAGATNALAAAEGDTNMVAAAEDGDGKPPEKKKRSGAFGKIMDGIDAFNDPANAGQRKVVIYMLFVSLIFTTLTTVMSVPYYALGIELSPTYNGRTQVVTYRAVIDKIAGLVAPWVAPFCFLTIFATALEGMVWVAIFTVIIGVPSTVLMVIYTRARTHVSMQRMKKMRLGFWKSIWYTLKNPHFLKVFALYQFIGLSNGLFQQIGMFLNIYWVMGSAQKGTTLGAAVAMVAWGLSFAALPVLNWACRRFQKHNTLRFAIIWMSIGCVLKWWCMNPEHPEYQFILPIFFSIGIASVYTVLSTLMADVTDVDELRTGTRREGMFGATMAFMMKTIGGVTPILAGAILVISGFDAGLDVQTPETIFNMRLLYSFVPGGMLLFSLLILWGYPLTAKRMTEIKAELARRRAEADAALAAEEEAGDGAV
jgi:GPH family glycoside/pentoside/hexuronide:cation symporter